MDLVNELKLSISEKLLIINLAPDTIDPLVDNELKQAGLKPDIIIPEDKVLYRYDLEQKPLTEMPDNSQAVQAIQRLMSQINKHWSN